MTTQDAQTPAAAEDASVHPTVTVVIPTRDRPDLLRRAVQAVLDQDYPGRIECVVVFDRTEPAAPQVQVPTGRDLVVTTNQRSPGLAGTRNTGILAATGEFVAHCDDDDEWLPAKLSRQVAMLVASPHASAAATGILIHYRGTDRPRLPAASSLGFDDLLRDRHMEVHPSSFLVRRDLLLGPVGLVDEEIPGGYAEDYEWLLRAARQGPVVCVLEPLVRVHWHDSSFFVSRYRTVIDALTYLLQRYPEFDREPAGLARIEGQVAFAHAALGERRQAWAWARRAIRRPGRPRHAYAAVAVASGLVSADRVLSLARRAGRGL